MRNIAGDAWTFFNGPLHMDVPVNADQQKIIYLSNVGTQDVNWKNAGSDRWYERMEKGEGERGR